MNTRIPELGFTYLKAEELGHEIRVKWDVGNDKTIRVVAPWRNKSDAGKDVQTLLKEYNELFKNANAGTPAEEEGVTPSLSPEENEIVSKSTTILTRHEHNKREKTKMH
jgi:hypothetical protein